MARRPQRKARSGIDSFVRNLFGSKRQVPAPVTAQRGAGRLLLAPHRPSPSEASTIASALAVMQEDQLLSGPIADNIGFLDPSFDQERMIQCAHLAGIHEEIMAMPMTYTSLTITRDMGSSRPRSSRWRTECATDLSSLEVEVAV
jgi:hypothetical protein